VPTPPALSVLDQTPVPDGFTAAEAVAHTLALARATDRLGYRRYWLAEHHDTPSLAGTAPEILVSAVAAATAAMRVGSGGVLLPYYSPLKVAEVFRMLHTLHPGRIDLGVGRAAGTDPAAEAALLASGGASGEEHFAEHVAELVGFLHDDFDPAHPWAAVRAMPDGPGAPALWLLGSSSHSTSIAAALKLSFAFAHFITPDFGPRLMASYRRRLRIPAREDVPDAGERSRPRAAVAVSVLCADTDAAARAQASTTDRWRLGPEGSTRPPILPPDAVAAAPWTELERLRAAQSRAKTFVGTPEQVRPRLEALAAEFEVDELIVLTVCHDPAARLRSYELLAEAFGLTAPPRP
jgi:luciferase family oxidoreductase group 1